MNRMIIVLGLLCPTTCVTSGPINDSLEPKIQACVLYGTNERSGYPIPKLKCVETHVGIGCNQKVVDSDVSSKIWRVYPESDCSDPGVKAGLSERYLIEGVD